MRYFVFALILMATPALASPYDYCLGLNKVKDMRACMAYVQQHIQQQEFEVRRDQALLEDYQRNTQLLYAPNVQRTNCMSNLDNSGFSCVTR